MIEGHETEEGERGRIGEVARKKKNTSGDKGGVKGSEWRGSSEVRRVGERVEKVGCNP